MHQNDEASHGGMLGPTVLAFALLAVGMLVPNTFGTLAVFMQPELGFDDAQLGQLLAIFWLATSFFAVASGSLADRTGWRRSALTGCLLITTTLGMLALARGFTGLAVTMVIGALGYGFCSPASNLIVVRLVDLSRQTFSLGIKQTAPTVITMAGGLTIPAVAAANGWRSVLLVGAPALLVPVAFALFWKTGRHREGHTGRGGRRALLSTGGRRELILLTCANGMGTFGMAGASGFGVRSLIDAGVDVTWAGTALAAASAAALCVRVFGGWWLDRLSSRGNVALLGLVAVGALGALMMASTWPPVMMAGLTLSVCGSWSWPPLLLMRVVRRYSHASGSASGHLQVGAGIGAATGPLAFGLVAQQTSFTAAWIMIASSAAVAATLIARGNGEHG